jgi:anti-sigma factor RsiW
MIHEESMLTIHAYLDGELDPINALAVEKRMATDPALAAECGHMEALQRLMREHLPREAPPPGLRARVETAVGMRRPHARFAVFLACSRRLDRRDSVRRQQLDIHASCAFAVQFGPRRHR